MRKNILLEGKWFMKNKIMLGYDVFIILWVLLGGGIESVGESR